MKLLYRLLIVFLTCSLFGSIYGGKSNNRKTRLPKKYNIGLATGYVTGPGVSYRQWSDLNGFQITGAPIMDEHKVDMYFGILGLRTIFVKEPSHLYLYYGGHLNYHNSDELDTYKEESNINIGFGPGVEFNLLNVSFNLMTGFFGSYSFSNKYKILPTIECGVYYSFDNIIGK